MVSIYLPPIDIPQDVMDKYAQEEAIIKLFKIDIQYSRDYSYNGFVKMIVVREVNETAVIFRETRQYLFGSNERQEPQQMEYSVVRVGGSRVKSTSIRLLEWQMKMIFGFKEDDFVKKDFKTKEYRWNPTGQYDSLEQEGYDKIDDMNEQFEKINDLGEAATLSVRTHLLKFGFIEGDMDFDSIDRAIAERYNLEGY